MRIRTRMGIGVAIRIAVYTGAQTWFQAVWGAIRARIVIRIRMRMRIRIRIRAYTQVV